MNDWLPAKWLLIYSLCTAGHTMFFRQLYSTRHGSHELLQHGPLARYLNVWVAHAPGMPGTFPHHRLQRKPLVSDPVMHHGTCVMHVPWCMSGSLTCDGGGKRSRHSRHMHNPQFYVSGKRPIELLILLAAWIYSKLRLAMEPITVAMPKWKKNQNAAHK